MATPEAILQAIAPETSTLDSGVVQVHIDLAEQQTGTVFKEARNHAVALLAAHTLSLSTRGGASGNVSNMSEGQLSIGFTSHGGTSELGATSYGAELLRLRRSYIISARTVHV